MHMNSTEILPFIGITEHLFDLILIVIASGIVLGKMAYDSLAKKEA